MRSSVADLHGNTVNYGYWCDANRECYLNTVTYNGTVITLYREADPAARDVCRRRGTDESKLPEEDDRRGGQRRACVGIPALL